MFIVEILDRNNPMPKCGVNSKLLIFHWKLDGSFLKIKIHTPFLRYANV